jgi:hypothetical protein
MSTASGSRHSVALIAEAQYGVTPATPVFDPIRHTSCTLALTKDALQSEEITSSRQITALETGAKKAGGDIGIELSYGTFDTILQALMCGTWATNVLKAGTTRRSFTIERRFEDLAKFMRFTGCEFDKLQIQASANAIVKATLSVIGQDMALDTAIITGATYNNPTTTSPVVSFRGVLKEGGVTTAAVTEISLSIDNGLQALYAIGSQVTNQPTIGKSNVSGQMTAYFQDTTLLDKFVNDTESSLEVTFSDVAGNSIKLEIPRLRYTGAPPDVKNVGPITLALPWQALYSSSSVSNLVITRTPHV